MQCRVWTCVALALLAAWCGGCGKKTYDRYVPAEAPARAALETVLAAWRDGQPFGTVRQGTRTFEVVDPQWRDGRKLVEFEVLQETPGTGPKRFSVRLRLSGANSPEQVTYVIAGREPLWVYREDEFKKLSGM